LEGTIPGTLGEGRDGPASKGGFGETLCVFDEPGRRYADVAQLRLIFTDIFPCYLEEEFDVAHGTMFRLPLRTDGMAMESELSDNVVTSELIDSLFTRFRQDIFDCLLFLNNVDSISLHEVRLEDSSTPSVLYNRPTQVVNFQQILGFILGG